MSLRLVSLGDSFSCGEGVGLRVDLAATWAGLLAAALPGARWTPLAAPGARTRDVRDRQLPAALAVRPDLATLLVGLNDVIRSGFDADAVGSDLHQIVTTLQATGCSVLLARLHDPGALLRLAGPMRRAVMVRVTAVNAAVDEISSRTKSPVFDLALIDALAEQSSWAVDRLHPSPAGHHEMARAAACALRTAGVAVHVPPAASVAPAPGAVATLRWVLAHGLPWGATHARSVGLPMLAAAGRRR